SNRFEDTFGTLDTLTSIERLILSNSDDRVSGSAVQDQFDGRGGNDRFFGHDGNDFISSGDDNDTLQGDEGNDTLRGADTFILRDISETAVGANRDRITDFDRAEGDVIDLSLIDADPSTANDDPFTFVGAFSGAAGEAIIETVGARFVVALDVTGSGNRDAEIFVAASALDASDFIL
ncbi:MAG: type I secretion C-terminal target domain-containing protein, partial [Alphaproteobacteria bacterium]